MQEKANEMIKIFIDKEPVDAEEGTTVLKAAERAGIHIPHLCYHPAFPPEGSCRMCLVEIEGFPKLELPLIVPSVIRLETANYRIITTNTDFLKASLKRRKKKERKN
jgi:predicted molibdopterin-dependent oxidoreductase YjgC